MILLNNPVHMVTALKGRILSLSIQVSVSDDSVIVNDVERNWRGLF
jgi:hypothetical protein